jgi:hypothetical protein
MELISEYIKRFDIGKAQFDLSVPLDQVVDCCHYALQNAYFETNDIKLIRNQSQIFRVIGFRRMVYSGSVSFLKGPLYWHFSVFLEGFAVPRTQEFSTLAEMLNFLDFYCVYYV